MNKIRNNKQVILITFIFIIAPISAFAATLSVMPSSGNITVGDTFPVTIQLDTENVSVDGVDIVYLNYNPAILQVQDSDPVAGGIQIATGTLMSSTLINSVDNSLGRITFSQVSGGGVKYNGSGTLATIFFKAITAGTVNLTFNHTTGLTTDSNVASNQIDVLGAVTNGTYTINNPQPPSTPPSSGGGGGGGGGGSGSTGSGGGYTSQISTLTNVGNTSSLTNIALNQTIINVPVNITRWLTLGSSGPDVLQLNKALNQNGFIVATAGPDSLNNETAYFGTATMMALKRFQCAKLQVCYGTPETTGYGGVGPRTRQALSLLKITTMTATNIASTTTTSLPGCPPGFVCRLAVNSTTSPSIKNQATIDPKTFTRSLTLGSTGLDVKALQAYLNSHGFIVSAVGAGSPGNETMYFGPATQAALARFQKAKGIVPAMGYFGPVTRTYVK